MASKLKSIAWFLIDPLMLKSQRYPKASWLSRREPVSLQDSHNSLFEICKVDPQCPLPPDKAVRLNGFEIIWFMKGEGCLMIDGSKNILSENILFFLAPGQWRYLDAQADFEYCIIDFSGQFLHGYEETLALPCLRDSYGSSLALPATRIEDEVLKELEDLMSKMIKEFNIYNLQRIEILKGILKLFLLYFSTQINMGYKNSHCNNNQELVKKFLTQLQKSYKTQKMVADYANELRISPNHLNEVVKKTTGFSASHHIQKFIINEAKNLATYTPGNMKEIAYSLGYTDLAHFSKFFRKAAGMNFTTFKKELRN